MKLSFEKSDLISGINIVLKAVPAKSPMPILECILIDASAGDIRLTGNDTEIGIETAVEGEILEPGRIALDAKLFSDIVRRMPDDRIYIDSENSENVRIHCGKANFNISGHRGDDFVMLPEMERNNYICISEFALKEVIGQTIFSIAPGESSSSNPMMSGELFSINGGRLKVVSLDGHRISIRNIDLRDTYGETEVIVPGKTLSEIRSILPGEQDKDVYLYFAKNQIMFEFGSTIVISRLIEGEYFHVDQMISNDYETKITLNRQEFLAAIERSTLLIRESDKKPIIFDIKDGNMEITMNSVIGSMHEEIAVEKSGSDLTIGFNPHFLIDALRVISDEEVSIYLINSKAPCFIRDDEDHYNYMILPINFSR